MDRKAICMVVCVMIAVGGVLNIVGQALEQELKIKQDKNAKVPITQDQMDRLIRGSQWCLNLSYLIGAVTLLLILCCLCCKGVSFGGSSGSASDYE